MTARRDGPDKLDAEFMVSLPVMAEVFEDLLSFRRHLAAQIDSAHHTVMALGSDWSGDARAAQLEFFAKLRVGLEKVDEGIAEFAESISQSKDHYAKAIQTNMSMWNNGR